MRDSHEVLLLLATGGTAVAAQSLYDDLSDVWVSIEVSVACDYSNPRTRAFAMGTAKPSRNSSGALSLEQVCNAFDAVKPPNWTYFHDPQRTRFGEDVAYASESIRIGLRGDCDDFAVLVAGCIRAIGGACRIALTYAEHGTGHAFAEVYVGDARNTIAASQYIMRRYSVVHVFCQYDQKTAGWRLSLDWSGSNSGQYPGQDPLIDPNAALRFLYVPIHSAADFARTQRLPVPSVP